MFRFLCFLTLDFWLIGAHKAAARNSEGVGKLFIEMKEDQIKFLAWLRDGSKTDHVKDKAKYADVYLQIQQSIVDGENDDMFTGQTFQKMYQML